MKYELEVVKNPPILLKSEDEQYSRSIILSSVDSSVVCQVQDLLTCSLSLGQHTSKEDMNKQKRAQRGAVSFPRG